MQSFTSASVLTDLPLFASFINYICTKIYEQNIYTGNKDVINMFICQFKTFNGNLWFSKAQYQASLFYAKPM